MTFPASDSSCSSVASENSTNVTSFSSVHDSLSRSHTTPSCGKRKITAVRSDSAPCRSEKLQRVRDCAGDCARACASDSAHSAATPLEGDERNLFDNYVFGPSSAHPIDESFEVDREVMGSGQFGTVRRCVHRETGLPFACKSIPKQQLVSENARNKLRREVRTMQRVAGHPGVVQLRGVFEDADSVHLVMDLCDAGELFGVIARRGALTEEEAALILWQLASGVAFCHSRGVLHRDLKPENILLTMIRGPPTDAVFPAEGAAHDEADYNEDNDFLAVRIADFGLAIELEAHQVAHGAAGSPLYVAPEVLTGEYGYSADVWSLGVILVVMLSGRPPFWGSSNLEIFESVIQAPVQFTGESWKGVSAEAKNLIRSMLQKDPPRRPSAAKVLSHPWVQRHLRGEQSSGRNAFEECIGTRLEPVCL